jgi:hypothetical protein
VVDKSFNIQQTDENYLDISHISLVLEFVSSHWKLWIIGRSNSVTFVQMLEFVHQTCLNFFVNFHMIPS